MTKPVSSDHLAAAVEALGKLMHTLNARRLVASFATPPPYEPGTVGARLAETAATSDEELLDIASSAFEAAARELARVGHTGAQHFECGPTPPTGGESEE